MKYEENVELKIKLTRFSFVFAIFIISVDLSAFIIPGEASDFEVNTESKVKWKEVILVKQAFDAEWKPLCPPIMNVFTYPDKCKDLTGRGRASDSQQKPTKTGNALRLPPFVVASTTEKSSRTDALVDQGPTIAVGPDAAGAVEKENVVLAPFFFATKKSRSKDAPVDQAPAVAEAPNADGAVGVDGDMIISTPELDCPKGKNRNLMGKCKDIW